MHHKFSFKTPIHFLIFVFIFLISNQAQAQVQISDNCVAPLNQADTVYQLTANITGNCTVTANNIAIDGLDLYSINGEILADGLIEGSDGFDITLQNITVADIYTEGEDSNSGLGGRGGDVTLINATSGNIITSGGIDNRFGDPFQSPGGSITLTDSVAGILTSVAKHVGTGVPSITLTGSTVQSINTGSVVIEITDSTITGNIIANQSSVTLTNSEAGIITTDGTCGYNRGSFAGGDVTLVDSTAISISANGGCGFYYVSAKNAGNVTLSDSTVGTISTVGGEDTINQNAGLGGDVTLTNSTSSDIDARGGDSDNDDGGEGGSVALTNSTSGNIDARGGNSNMSTPGVGGAVTLTQNSTSGDINTSGGAISFIMPPNSANAGSISITDSTSGDIIANGTIFPTARDELISITLTNSTANSITTNVETVTLSDSTITTDIIANGSIVELTNSTVDLINADGADSPIIFDGQDGGTVTLIESTVEIITANGGNAPEENTAGNAGMVFLTDSLVETITVNGGDSGYGTPGNPGSIFLTDSFVTGSITAYGGIQTMLIYPPGEEPPIPEGTLTIVDNTPTITAPNTSIDYEDIFDPLEDVTAEDIKNGNLTSSIQVTSGEVLENEGVYQIQYSVTDLGTTVTFNGDTVTSTPATNTTTLTRTITRLANNSSTSGSGGGGGGRSRVTPTTTTTPTLCSVSSVEIECLKSLLAQLQAQLAALLVNTPALSNNPFTRDLYADMDGEDVKQLQILLNSKGYIINTPPLPGAPGYESTYFGNKTQDAVKKFQQDKGIVPATGYFGPLTRAKILE